MDSWQTKRIRKATKKIPAYEFETMQLLVDRDQTVRKQLENLQKKLREDPIATSNEQVYCWEDDGQLVFGWDKEVFG